MNDLKDDLESKAKTPLEIEKMVKNHMKLFRMGAMGNHEAYNQARDTRHLIEEDKWVRLEDAQKEIQRLENVIVELTNQTVEYEEKTEKKLSEARQLLSEFPDADVSGESDFVQFTFINIEEWLEKIRRAVGSGKKKEKTET